MRVLLLLALSGCNVSVGVDEVIWACAADGDCGVGARCVAHACVPVPSAKRCTTRTVAGVSVGFAIEGNTLFVQADGGAAKDFLLPAGVALDEPVVGCCEHRCCVGRAP